MSILQKSDNFDWHRFQGQWNVQSLFLTSAAFFFAQASSNTTNSLQANIRLENKHVNLKSQLHAKSDNSFRTRNYQLQCPKLPNITLIDPDTLYEIEAIFKHLQHLLRKLQIL